MEEEKLLVLNLNLQLKLKAQQHTTELQKVLKCLLIEIPNFRNYLKFICSSCCSKLKYKHFKLNFITVQQTFHY